MIGRSPFLQQFRESNCQLVLRGKRVLVVGGTAGIGAAAAVRFAQLGADVTIAGRNKESGDAVIAKMRSVAPPASGDLAAPRFEFRKVDMSLLADVNTFARDYTNSLISTQGLNVLVVTSGGLNLGPVRNTSEGIEHNFALSFLGRFLLINRLLPVLIKEENSRVISVLSAGRADRPLDLEDPQMHKEGAYSKTKSERYNSIANDFMMEELTKRYSNNHKISFFHVSPGIVATDLMKNSGSSGWLNWGLKTLSSALGQQPEEYAETLVHIATSPDLAQSSGLGLSRDATPVKRTSALDEAGAREKFWAYSAKVSGLDS